MTTSFDTDQNTQAAQTVAAAWASSPLGQPDREVGFGSAGEILADETVADETVAAETVAEERRPASKHAFVALALAGGIGAGAALGLMFADFTPDQPVVVPGSTAPEHAVVVTDTGQPAANEVLDVFAPTTIAPAPANDVGTPPASAPAQSTVLDVLTQQPPAPEKPADQGEPESPVDPETPADPEQPVDPEDPGPKPPVFDPDLPKAPAPEPKPQPPVFDPDLPKAPVPQPTLDPKPLPLPDLDIKAGPNS